MKFVAIDYESSGLDPKRHAPVTLGVALMDGFDVLASQEWRFSPPTNKDGKVTREYDAFALEISGSSLEQLREGQTVAVVMRELEEWAVRHDCASSLVVAFNAPFDFSFYSECLFLGGSWNQRTRSFQTFKPPLTGPWQCARMMAARQLSLEKYSLDAVAAHFGLERSGETHGALEDAILAGKVFTLLYPMGRATEKAS